MTDPRDRRAACARSEPREAGRHRAARPAAPGVRRRPAVWALYILLAPHLPRLSRRPSLVVSLAVNLTLVSLCASACCRCASMGHRALLVAVVGAALGALSTAFGWVALADPAKVLLRRRARVLARGADDEPRHRRGDRGAGGRGGHRQRRRRGRPRRCWRTRRGRWATSPWPSPGRGATRSGVHGPGRERRHLLLPLPLRRAALPPARWRPPRSAWRSRSWSAW